MSVLEEVNNAGSRAPLGLGGDEEEGRGGGGVMDPQQHGGPPLTAPPRACEPRLGYTVVAPHSTQNTSIRPTLL